MVNEQKTFSEIERLSKIALEAGDLVKLQNMLLPLLREDDRSRSVSENLFIYRTLGTIYEEQGQHAESLIAYEQAHGYDARDFETRGGRRELFRRIHGLGRARLRCSRFRNTQYTRRCRAQKRRHRARRAQNARVDDLSPRNAQTRTRHAHLQGNGRCTTRKRRALPSP